MIRIVVLISLLTICASAQEAPNLLTVYRCRVDGKFYEYKTEVTEAQLLGDNFWGELPKLVASPKFDILKKIDQKYQIDSVAFKRASSNKNVWVAVVYSYLKTDAGINYREMKEDVYLLPDMKKLEKVMVK